MKKVLAILLGDTIPNLPSEGTIVNNTIFWLCIQISFNSLAKVVMGSKTALNFLFADLGRVCEIINTIINH